MAISSTYPGVYIEEIPSGVRSITGVSTSITAFVGYTERGPQDKAVRIFSFADFERTFGDLSQSSDVSYAVQQFFLNGGSEAYVVRVAKGAEVASVVLENNASAPVLSVAAASPGAFGNMIRFDVDYGTTNPDSSFNMSVIRYELVGGVSVPAESEQLRSLSMSHCSANYAPSVVNSVSRMIRLTDIYDGAYNAGFSLSGDLSAFPTLGAGMRSISGNLNTDVPFTLVMTGSPPASIDALVASIDMAIAAAGLSSCMSVERADAFGAPDTEGTRIRIVSASTGSCSAVQIVATTNNDTSHALSLGLNGGGREVEGASVARPAMTGTTDGDLAEVLGSNLSTLFPLPLGIDVTITDNGTGNDIVTDATIAISEDVVIGPALAAVLQERIRGILNVPAAQNATVSLNGTFLRIHSSADTPDASISLSASFGSTVVENLQQYNVGVGAAVLNQGATTPGADGTVPDAGDIIGSPRNKTGLYSLVDVDLFNLLSIPGTARLTQTQAQSVVDAAIRLCEKRRAFYIVDPVGSVTLSNGTSVTEWARGVRSRNAAVYFPRVSVPDPLAGLHPRDMPVSGVVAGVFARTDAERGVWKAPAGIDAVIRGVTGLSYILTDDETGALNTVGVNALRTFPLYGTVVWGARTRRGSDQEGDEYKHIPVRRLALYIEETLLRGLKWAVFELNDEPLWAQIRLNVGAFLHNLFRQGAFQGNAPGESYFVKCDNATTTQSDIDKGVVNIVVGFAPVKPAEFVIIRLEQIAGQIRS